MHRQSKYIFLYLLVVIAIVGSLAYSCSANSSVQSTPTTQSSQPSAGPTPTTQSSQPPAGPTPTSQSSQPPAGQSRANAPDMQAIFTQVAQQLGISEDTLAAAYQQAQTSVMSSMPARNRTSQGEAQQPSQGQQPPNTSGQSQSGNDFRTSIYNNMANILNIPADKIAAAFSNFEQQFSKSRGATTNQ